MNMKIIGIFLAFLVISCTETEVPGVPDAGTSEKVVCRQCVHYCESVCYKKRYDNTLACTADVYYRHCLNRCGLDIADLPELCTVEYLTLQSCILNGRSPVYVCTSGQPTLRESWRCMSASVALNYCRATAPY